LGCIRWMSTPDEIRDTGYEIRDTRYEIRGTRYEVRGTRYEVRGTRSSVGAPRSAAPLCVVGIEAARCCWLSSSMRSHRDLLAWQVANAVAVEVHRWANIHWAPSRRCALDQLRRSSLSAALNIVEGFASGPGRRCRYHLRVAYGSAVETTALLEFFAELGIEAPELVSESIRTQQLVNRLWRRSRAA
jgi:four helix bundle protein